MKKYRLQHKDNTLQASALPMLQPQPIDRSHLHAAPATAVADGVQPGDGGAAQLGQAVRAQRPGRRRAGRQRAAPPADGQVALQLAVDWVGRRPDGRTQDSAMHELDKLSHCQGLRLDLVA